MIKQSNQPNQSTNKKNMLEQTIFPILAREGKLFGYTFSGQWFDVGDLESYEEAIKNWKNVKN